MLMVLRPARLNPYAFINVFLRVAGYFYNMTNDNQHHVLEKGKSAVLECEFHADSYNLFNNPVLWTKIQLNERTPVNLLGNLNEPFASTNRFEVSFTASPPRYRFELSVLDVTPEDSGNYTCEVKASNFLILASMIHFLYVRDDVKNLFVVRGNEVPFDHRLNSSVIKVIEGKPVRLTCISFGGYPPPKLELSLGKQDITALFEFRSSAVLTGSRGMRKVTFKNERWMNNMRFEAAENGNVLKCISTVPGYEPRHYEAHLEVQYAPRVTCLDAIVAVDNDDVVLRCNVTSRPPPTTLVWILNNETNLTQHSRHLPNVFVTNRDFGNGIMQTSLVVRSVSSDDVRKYSVIVGNDVAETTNQVEIRRKSKIQIDGNVLVSDSMSYHVTNNNNFNKKLNELLKGKKAARTRPSSDHHHHHHHHIHHRHKDEQQHGPSAQQLNSAGSNFSFLHLVVVVATLLFFVKMLTMTKNHLSL